MGIRAKTLRRLRRWRRIRFPARLHTAFLKLRYPDLRGQQLWCGWNGRLSKDVTAELRLEGGLVIGDIKGRRKRRKHKPKRKRPTTIGPPEPMPAIVHLKQGSRLETGGWVYVSPGARIAVGRDARLAIGESTYFTGGTVLCTESIEIGESCAIGWDVTIMDSDMHPLVVEGEPSPMTKPIKIGNHVWIGAGARILKGVTIGDGAVIAGGAIVTKEVAPRTLVGGNPARLLKKDVEWS